IRLAKTCIRVQRVGILTQKIVVSLIIEIGNGIGVDVLAGHLTFHTQLKVRWNVWIQDRQAANDAVGVIGYTGNPRKCLLWGRIFSIPCVRGKRERVDKHIVIFLSLVMQIVATNAEIERSGKIGGQAKFLAELPRMLIVQILGNKSITTTELGITIRTNRCADLIVAEFDSCWRAGLINCRAIHALYVPDTNANAIIWIDWGRGIEPTASYKSPRPRIEAIVVFCRPKKVAIVSGLRCKCQ